MASLLSLSRVELPVIFLKLFISGKKNFSFYKKLVCHKSINIFKGNIGNRSPLLVFPCFIYQGLIKYTTVYLKIKIFRVIVKFIKILNFSKKLVLLENNFNENFFATEKNLEKKRKLGKWQHY